MSRIIRVEAAQSGPVLRQESRADVVERLIGQMQKAQADGCQLVVFTECALTAFFPHWWIESEDELDGWFEREMPNEATRPLFDEAARLGIGFYLGFAELVVEDRTKDPNRHHWASLALRQAAASSADSNVLLVPMHELPVPFR